MQTKVRKIIRSAKRQTWQKFCNKIGRSTPVGEVWAGAPLRILGPLDSRGGGGSMAGDTEGYRDCVPEPVFFSPSPKSDYTVSAIKIVQFCM